jgi:hypothetical protein
VLAYVGYARVAVSRDAAGWDVVDNEASNKTLVQFPECTGGTGATITHIAIGAASSGAGQILYSGALNAPLNVSNLVQPQFAIGGLVVEED